MVICIWYCYGFIYLFPVQNPFVKREKNKCRITRPLNITFVTLLEKKKMLVRKKKAIGKLLMAMKTLTHLCETVFLIEVCHPHCQCSKILFTHYIQMAHCGPITEPNKNLIKPTWWRTFDDDEKVSFVVVLFQIIFHVRVHSLNSCTWYVSQFTRCWIKVFKPCFKLAVTFIAFGLTSIYVCYNISLCYCEYTPVKWNESFLCSICGNV